MIIDHLFESAAPGPSLEQLATISDQALDNAYHYGRSSPGNTFGWQANLKSAAYAKRMIDAGETNIDRIADAIHQGWNVTARAFVANPDQFDDTAKLRAAGKLEAKLEQRAKLMKIGYAQLPDEEQEKDRVVARALLQALRGKPGVAEAPGSSPSRRRRALDTIAAQKRGEPTPDQLDAKLYQDWYQKLQQKKPAPEPGVAEAKTLKKRVRVVQGPHSGKTGWIREIQHGLYQGAPKRYYVDLDDGTQVNNVPGSALRLIKDEQGMTETSDYARRREREEAIISGKKPPRKKQPAQTSDYARRRAQEKAKDQGVAEGDVIRTKFATKQAQRAKDQYQHQPDVEIPVYDRRRNRAVLPKYAQGGEEAFDHFRAEASPRSSRSSMIIGVTKDFRKVVVSSWLAPVEVTRKFAAAMNRGGFSDVPIQRVPIRGYDDEPVAESRFDQPLTGWHIVSRAHDQVVQGTPSFATQDQAQKYLMTRMFANHQDFKVVHIAGVAEGDLTEISKETAASYFDKSLDRSIAMTDQRKAAKKAGDVNAVKSLDAKFKKMKSGMTRALKRMKGVAEGSDKLQGTPVISLSDLTDKDYKKNKYGQTVPKKLKKDDPRVKFYKEPKKQGVTEATQNSVQGPYKVTGFDPNTRTVSMENHADIVLDQSIKDQPRPGYNYAFQISGNTANKIILLTADNVITTGKEILLIKRKNQPYAGFWALPGGFIDPGESPEQAARRELAEETGLQTTASMKFIGKFDTPGRDPRMTDVWSYAYLAIISKESVRAGDDASQTKWVPIEQLAKLNLAFDHAQIIAKSGIVKLSVAEGKVKLFTDPDYFGAEVNDKGFDKLPIVNIPTNRLVGFEPDSKMQDPKSKANVKKILAGLKQGDNIPPILVRKYKTGYQVLDGHHRFWAYKVAKKNTIPARVVDPEDIEEVGKSGVAEGRFDEPLTGWHIVYRKSGNPVHATPSFETKDQAQKYLMTKMFANHQDYKVVHTAGVGVAEGWKDIVAGGALALGAGAAGAQTMPNINAQQVELANKYYNVLVQRAKEDGRELDRRTLNFLRAKAEDAAAKKVQQNTPQQQNTFPSQGSERKVSKDIGQFESQGVAEAHLDPSGLQAAAAMVRDFIITADVDGQTKKFRVRGMTGPRAAKERFLKHHGMAKVVDVQPEKGVKEGLRDPKDNPCWKGYYPVGTKQKNGRTVPNCVPRK